MKKFRLFDQMLAPSSLSRPSSSLLRIRPSSKPQSQPRWVCTQCLSRQKIPVRVLKGQRRYQTASGNPADQSGFTSIVDHPPVLVRAGRRHNKLGLAVLAAIPLTAFVLGCWQVQRLKWKTALIAKYEDRLVRDPLPLPPHIDLDAIHEFDYRRVYAVGKWRHEDEMLLGPRLHDGDDGYLVITPLDRSAHFPPSPNEENEKSLVKKNSTILVCRGWIPKSKAPKSSRPEGLPTGDVVVQGLLREPRKKNFFTPDNQPEQGNWYFPDVYQMAENAGSQAVWVEETMQPDLLASYKRESKGIPIGRPPEVNIRNHHTQYIFTWFSLSLATSVMLAMVLKRPTNSTFRRIRQNKEW